MKPAFGAVVLTLGRRPDELRRAVDSLLDQRGVDVDLVVVGNGWEPTGLPPGAGALGLPENLGIPAGRNAGVPVVRGDLLFFLDDDAYVAEPDALARVAREFSADPRLGLMQLRVDPLGAGAAPQEWVPRLRARGRTRPGEVTLVWEGAVAARRSVFEAVGGWPAEFRFVHEGVDLGWRVMDAGYRVRYAGDIAARHPPVKEAPRHYSAYYGARNRVWLARRHLPLPLGAAYVATFALRTLPRLDERAEALRGYRDGLRSDCGPRRRLRARTLWRMLMTGRPPIL